MKGHYKARRISYFYCSQWQSVTYTVKKYLRLQSDFQYVGLPLSQQFIFAAEPTAASHAFVSGVICS